MAPLRGWAPVGERLHAKVPYGHWRTMTFLAALRYDRIDAPCVLDQPINGQSFTDYVEQCLVPTLSPGDVVIMDNLSSHKRPDPKSDPRRRSQALVPAAVQPRSQSDRAGLRQAQTPDAQSRRANTRSNVAAHWIAARRIQP